MKKSKKFLAVLSTSAMLATLSAPAVLPGVASSVAFAAGSGSLTATTVPTVQNDSSIQQALGAVQITIPQYTLKPGSTVTIKLPKGVKLPSKTVSGQVYYDFQTVESGSVDSSNPGFTSFDNKVVVNNDGLSSAKLGVGDLFQDIKVLSDDQIQLTLKDATSLGYDTNNDDDTTLTLYLNKVYVSGASNGPINLNFDAPSESSFPVGDVTVAKVSSSGQVDVSALDTETKSDNFHFDLRLKEDVVGSFEDGKYVKIKLPSGYKWNVDTTAIKSKIVNLYGGYYDATASDPAITLDPSDNELVINFHKTTSGSSTSAVQIPLDFTVSDDNDVKSGDIVATVTGNVDTDVSQLVVGAYGDYSSSVSAESTPDIIAGKDQQEIGNIVIKESIGGTLVSGRTVTLTLPDGARWQEDFEKSGNTTDADVPGSGFTSDQGLHLKFVGYTDSNHKTAKFEVDGQSDENADTAPTIKLKNAEVAVEPTFSGDLNVTVGGTAGVSGTVKVATVKAPFTASVSSTPNLVIGAAGQSLGDITITENIAGAFSKNTTTHVKDSNNNEIDASNIAVLHLPSGVEWDGTPTVEVTSGDLKISNVTTNGSDLSFTVDGESTTPSTLKITNAKVKVYRTVPYGDVNLKVMGDAAAATARFVSAWSDQNYALKFPVAKVVTPASNDTTGKAAFTIGSTTYTVNGQSMTADVAPYIKNDRTYLPVTYVAQALGVPLQNIIWNNAERSVTIFKGDRVIKMVIGSNVLLVNGVQYTIDAAPEITNDRTMLPIAHIAVALGVPYTWDATTQTVTFGN
jgi:hypothetical protein